MSWDNLIANLSSVVVGFLLGFFSESFRERRGKSEESSNIRHVLHEEITYNKGVLKEIAKQVREEEKLYHETFQRDSAGGWTVKGDPWRTLLDFPTSRLSTDVWNSQMEKIPSALSGNDVAKLFEFYRNLAEIQALHEEYTKRKIPHVGLDNDLMKRIVGLMEETINKPLSVIK